MVAQAVYSLLHQLCRQLGAVSAQQYYLLVLFEQLLINIMLNITQAAIARCYAIKPRPDVMAQPMILSHSPIAANWPGYIL